MANRIGLSPLGSVVALKVIRDGKPVQLEVTIEEIPIPEIAGDKLHPSLSGVRLQDLIHPDYESAVGCIIVDIDQGSPAAQQGLEIGDIIFGANQKRVHNIDELVYLTSREPLRSFNLRRGYQELSLYLR
jgi:serine protease Do/serine protease DegQ